MSIPTSLAFSIGEAFADGGEDFGSCVKKVLSLLFDLHFVSGTDTDEYGRMPAGERTLRAATGISVLHDSGRPFPIILDTHSEPDTFPTARILVVLHDFDFAFYEEFDTLFKNAFGKDTEDHIVSF